MGPQFGKSIVCHGIYSHDLSNDDLSAQAVTKSCGFFPGRKPQICITLFPEVKLWTVKN